jgi:hypothetical protein
VNNILRDQWVELPGEEKLVWRDWATWDKNRYARDLGIYDKAPEAENAKAIQEEREKTAADEVEGEEDAMKQVHVPKKRPSPAESSNPASPFTSIPKKRKQR